MNVKIILKSEVAGLGEEGDVKNVAGGYARNYLLPKNLAIPATKGNLRILDQQRGQIERKQEQHRADAHALADRLAVLPLQFSVRVGEQGRLFGSVTAQDIVARVMSEAGIEVDRRAIVLKEPLRALGTYDVPVRVAHTVTAHISVTLRDQSVPEPAAPAPVAATMSADDSAEA